MNFDKIKRLELLLSGEPTGQDAALQDLLRQLEDDISKNRIASVEETLSMLATTVGKQKSWQSSYRECGVLQFVLKHLLKDRTASELNKQCLRVVGNCVADNDMNREIVVQQLLKLMACISLEDVATIAVIALFNLCNDFDQGILAAADLRLDVVILENLCSERISEGALEYAVELLTWTTEKLTAAHLQSLDTQKAFDYALTLALRHDEDHFYHYLAVLVYHLQQPILQTKAATSDFFDRLNDLIIDFQSHNTPDENEAVLEQLSITNTEDTAPSEAVDVLLLAQLINSIAMVTSSDTFAQNFNINSPLIKKLKANLSTPQELPSKVNACIVLGNLAISDQVCIDIVNKLELHTILISILSSSTSTALLYNAAGFVRHLAFPEVNRSILGDAGLLQACSRLLEHSDPSVRGEAAAILCKLVTSNLRNTEKTITELSSEMHGIGDNNVLIPATTTTTTIFALIVKQALAPSIPLPSTTMKNSVIELGRTIAAIFRTLARPDQTRDVTALRQEIFKVSLFARPVTRLIRQQFYPDARSEGLLGLGLIAQSPQGVSHIAAELEEDAGLLDAIKDLAVKKDENVAQQGLKMGRDLHNAIILMQALLYSGGQAMDQALKARVTSVQEELGKLMEDSSQLSS